MEKEFDRGSPSLTQRCDELDEQCRRTCGILRVWSTDHGLSSLNGSMVRKGSSWCKGMDGGALSLRERALASMEQQHFVDEFGKNREGRWQEVVGNCKRRWRRT